MSLDKIGASAPGLRRELMKDFRMLMKRKHKMFPDNKRIVVNFKIKERRDYRNIFVLSSPSSDQMKEILAKYNKPVK